ncbi:unnamed protein product [Amoebophrya sp. A120]|nr:unnamed protein product [Amoebophrya sp. A120]|eukprot:GSA120T00002928001.1
MASDSSVMRAVGIQQLGDASVLQDVTLPKPTATAWDVVVQLKACAVNPVDWKLRASNLGMPFPENETKVLGYDGSGVVVECGENASQKFKTGDEVFFAGNCLRNGTNADFCAVDSRLIAKKPQSLSFEQAAAFPLVAITGWENLCESAGIDKAKKTVLILAGAGGCGSFGIQLAKLYGCTVVATASSPESEKWCKNLGADYVISHSGGKTLLEELKEKTPLSAVDVAYVCHDDKRYSSEVTAVVGAMGVICPVVTFFPDEGTCMDMYLNRKSLCYGMMFCRGIHGKQPEKQGELLEKVAKFIDEGKLKPIATEILSGGLSAETFRKAHDLQESGHMRGKIVVPFA